jgi:hypothetical protein
MQYREERGGTEGGSHIWNTGQEGIFGDFPRRIISSEFFINVKRHRKIKSTTIVVRKKEERNGARIMIKDLLCDLFSQFLVHARPRLCQLHCVIFWRIFATFISRISCPKRRTK